VNQFVDATVQVAQLGVSVEQKAHFPMDPVKTSTLTVRMSKDGQLAGTKKFSIMIRCPSWAKGTNAITVNGAASGVKLVPGQYANISRDWADGDAVEVSFPPSLWTSPLNDYHPEHNATLAFMFGPLVLAGVHVDSDIFMPGTGASNCTQAHFQTDPSCFITRNSSAGKPLEFEAVGRGASNGVMKVIPLRDVMTERYVAYFMTAGTKPPQPNNGYCPHSEGDQVFSAPSQDLFDDSTLVSPGPPPAPAPDAEEAAHIVSSRGVHWKLANGRLSSSR
jgi:hypothetical protein